MNVCRSIFGESAKGEAWMANEVSHTFRRYPGTGACLCLAALTATPPGFAQNGVDDAIDEIIVTGTRRLNRTVAESPVPVDVFEGQELRNMGADDMDDILRTLVPSYNVQRYPLDDEDSLVRPATLRGLSGDKTLVLVNGKRRHRSAVLSSIKSSAQSPDMAVLPSIAFQRVEVLRDGASAQYGSDAIAGVINYILREDDDGITLDLKTSQYYEGDGQSWRAAVNAGLPMAGSGFINVSAEYGQTDSTTRSEQRFDARALQNMGVEGIPNPVQKYGQPTIDGELKLFINAAYELGNGDELYGFGNFADRDVAIDFFWRGPNAQNGVYTRGGDRLVIDLTPDGNGGCPTAGTPDAIPVPSQFFPTQEEVDANAEALALLAADPNCWTVNELYPTGYLPAYGADIRDWSMVYGYRGDTESGMRFDFSAAWGTSDIGYRLSDTLNPSLGPETPTSFRPGSSIQSEINLNADLAWELDVVAFDSPLTLATGLEWREESFETEAGDAASWAVGPFFDQGASIGSNGFPGFPPEQAGEWSRANWAAYLDLEADVTEDLLVGLAYRFEDFEDFGSTSNYKVAMRYRLVESFAVRASYSTGFRAPTPGQSNSTRTLTIGFNDELVQGGRIQPTNPVAVFFGGAPLEPEESKNLSAGFTWQPTDAFTLTADFFHIDIDDGMGLSPNIGLSPELVAELVAAGVPGASDFRFINFYVNGTDTKTKGIDVVASYDIQWRAAGNSTISLAWNRTEKEVVWMENPNRRFIIDREEGEPLNRGILTLNHGWNDWNFLLRASYYDGWVDADFNGTELEPVCADPTLGPPNPPGTDECYGSTWVVDAQAAYNFADRYTLIVGADNLFDEYPEEELDYPDFSFGVRYPRSSPIGYNGGLWYLRLQAQF